MSCSWTMVDFKEHVQRSAAPCRLLTHVCTYDRGTHVLHLRFSLTPLSQLRSVKKDGKISMGPPSVSCFTGLRGLENKGSQAWKQKNNVKS